jgi:Sulfotransferase family
MTLPTFLLIGPSRSGTTSLYYYLQQQPQVFMSRVKESNFFAYEGQDDPRRYPIRTRAQYEALFAAARADQAIGEASPFYLGSPVATERIRDAIPDARLITILRDPVARAHASYLAAVRNRRETRSFAELIRDHRSGARFSDFLDLSCYHRHLTRYRRHFPAEQISISLFDDFTREPLLIVRQILAFIGVNPDVEIDTRVQYNRSGLPRSRALELLMRENPLKERIKASLPLWARLQVVKLGSWINGFNLARRSLPEDARQEGIELFRDDVMQLEGLLGRDLSSWLA